MSQENKAYTVQLVKQIVHPYFAEVIADILIAHGMTFKTEPQTNADRIRAMSDEELATFIYTATRACNKYECDTCPIGEENCPNLNEWLKQPVKECPEYPEQQKGK